MKQAIYYIRIAGTLLGICMVVALLLAAANLATRDQIAENMQRDKQNAISALYPAFSDMREESSGLPAGVHTVYTITREGSLLGYAVALETRGFGGMIQMMVGISPDGAVSGVRVLSSNETPGLGSRALADSYLSRYLGMTAGGEAVDAISGASVSSRAVKAGVELALSLGLGGSHS